MGIGRSGAALVCALCSLLAACGDDTPVPDASMGDASCSEGAACDLDGDGCTQDVCRDGVCIARGPVDCDDGDGCTIDTCVMTSTTTYECRNDDDGRRCLIGGECFADGSPNPSNACEICDVSEDERDWSLSTAPCDDGDECTVEDSCASGMCMGTPVSDTHEPNDVPADATRLPEVSDGSDFPAGTERGAVFPDTDEDFFIYTVTDGFGGFVNPRVELKDVPRGSDYELCGFIQCLEGETSDVACSMGTSARFMDMQGCCSDLPDDSDEVIYFSPECAGTDDTLDVLVRIRNVGDEVDCTGEYSLEYGDD